MVYIRTLILIWNCQCYMQKSVWILQCVVIKICVLYYNKKCDLREFRIFHFNKNILYQNTILYIVSVNILKI